MRVMTLELRFLSSVLINPNLFARKSFCCTSGIKETNTMNNQKRFQMFFTVLSSSPALSFYAAVSQAP
jgi:hypothetical protein